MEEGPARKKPSTRATSAAASGGEEETAEEENVGEEEGAEEEDEEEDKFDIDDSSAEAQSAKDAAEAADSSASGLPVDNLKVDPDLIRPPSSGIGTPSRFASSSMPKPPPMPDHLLSDAAAKLQREEVEHHLPQTHRRLHPVPAPLPVHVSASQTSPEALRKMQAREEDGERDFIRAPESLMQSNKSKIPKDRDIEGDSMRTPRADAPSDHLRRNLSPGSGSRETAKPAKSPLHHTSHHHHQSPSYNAHPPTRNHKRHGSVDSGIGAPRRAFAAWGRDESDSNASDSDA